MTWSTRAAATAVPQEDVEDAITNGYVCPASGGFDPVPDLGTGHMWTRGNWELYVSGDGTVYDVQDSRSRSASGELCTKADIEAWRLWNPVEETIGAFSGTEDTSFKGGIIWSWTDDSDIPSVDSNWARDDVEVEIEVYSDSGLTTLVSTVDVNYGIETRPWTYPGGTPGNTYWARARYRNKTDTSLVGSWSSTASATYG